MERVRKCAFLMENISETVRDRAKVTINTNTMSHIAFQMTRTSLTLDDLKGQYCNRNCTGCSASYLATAGLFVFRGFRLRHIAQQWIVPKLLLGVTIDQDNMHMKFF